MAGKWRFNPSVHRAKGDRSVRAWALPVSNNEMRGHFSMANKCKLACNNHTIWNASTVKRSNSCAYILQTGYTQITPGLFWIQTVWHFGGIPERTLLKIIFKENQQTTKRCNLIQHAKCLSLGKRCQAFLEIPAIMSVSSRVGNCVPFIEVGKARHNSIIQSSLGCT